MAITQKVDPANPSHVFFSPVWDESYVSGMNKIDKVHASRAVLVPLLASEAFEDVTPDGQTEQLLGYFSNKTPFPTSIAARRLSFINRTAALFSDFQFDTKGGASREKPVLHVEPRGVVWSPSVDSGLLLRPSILSYADGSSGNGVSVVSGHEFLTAYNPAVDSVAVQADVSLGLYDLDPPAPGYYFNKVKYFATYLRDNQVSVVIGYYYAYSSTSIHIFVQRFIYTLQRMRKLDRDHDTVSDAFSFSCVRDHHTLYEGGGTASVDYFPVFANSYLAGLDPFSPDGSWVSFPVGIALCSMPASGSMRRLVGWSGSQYVDTGTSSFQRFIAEVAPYVGDAYGLLYRSTDAAVSEYLQESTSNFVESASEFSDLLGFVSIKELAIRMLSEKAVGAQLNRVSRLLRLLDILASATLIYRFGIAPNISDAREVRRLAEGIYPRVAALSRPKTLYGSETFSVPSQDPNDPILLTVHSKIRISVEPDTLLAWILGGIQNGTFPTLERIWDIIPGSFLLDYLVDVGSGLNAVDRSLLIMAFNVHDSVHSISFHKTLSNDTLARFGLQSTGRVYYQHYERMRLLNLPPVMPSRLSPLFSGRSPDIFVGGSLLYTFVRML